MARQGRTGPTLWCPRCLRFLPPPVSDPMRSDWRHITGPGLRWHADQLASLCQAKATLARSADRARRRYHARMLGHGLAPDRAEFRPLVTVLLPVYNRVGPLVEAVQSCIDQSWRPIEILVVDDGSTDDVPSALRRFGDQVRLIRKANGGVASARNLGLAAAQGDFIHFLDSDDLLAPDAVANAVAAFNAVADADLCYGQGQWIDMRSTPPQTKPLHVRQHANPIRALIVEFAFTVPTVMMPRWRMLSMPPFEEDLRRSSDWRYWQRLGFANIKAVGIRTLTAHLRRFEHSLQATPHPEDDSHAVAMLRGLRDLFQHPQAWPYAVEYANLLTSPRIQRWFEQAPSARIAPMLGEIAAALQAGSATNKPHGLSMLPVLAALNGRIDRMRQRRHWPDDDPASVYRALATLVARCDRRRGGDLRSRHRVLDRRAGAAAALSRPAPVLRRHPAPLRTCRRKASSATRCCVNSDRCRGAGSSAWRRGCSRSLARGWPARPPRPGRGEKAPSADPPRRPPSAALHRGGPPATSRTCAHRSISDHSG